MAVVHHGQLSSTSNSLFKQQHQECKALQVVLLLLDGHHGHAHSQLVSLSMTVTTLVNVGHALKTACTFFLLLPMLASTTYLGHGKDLGLLFVELTFPEVRVSRTWSFGMCLQSILQTACSLQRSGR